MKIFIAGATGVLGRRAVEQLVEAGHDVRGVARTDAKADLLTTLGASHERVDIFDAAAVKKATIGVDVVMNLATHIPALSKSMLKGSWKENDAIRSVAAGYLVDAAIANGAQRYIQESISFFYTETSGDWIDEDTPMELPAYAASVAEAEAHARRFTGDSVVLRFGMFYGADTAHTVAQMRIARRGFSPFVGDEDAYQSLIHLDDAASAVVAALDVPPGTYNIVEDEPMKRGDAAAVLAKLLGKKRLRPTPKAVRAVGGENLRALSRSVRVSNGRFKKAAGWQPRYPSAKEGMSQVLSA
jgi:nucleoside-diphosphate-sugar epimerase